MFLNCYLLGLICLNFLCLLHSSVLSNISCFTVVAF